LLRRAFIKRTLPAAVSSVLIKAQTAEAAPSLPPIGVRAPDFDLPNSRGEGVTSLGALIKTGKWTVLYFYPGAFTSGCTLEARGFQKVTIPHLTIYFHTFLQLKICSDIRNKIYDIFSGL